MGFAWVIWREFFSHENTPEGHTETHKSFGSLLEILVPRWQGSYIINYVNYQLGGVVVFKVEGGVTCILRRLPAA